LSSNRSTCCPFSYRGALEMAVELRLPMGMSIKYRKRLHVLIESREPVENTGGKVLSRM